MVIHLIRETRINSPDTMNEITRSMMIAQQPSRGTLQYMLYNSNEKYVKSGCFQKDKNKIFLVLQIPLQQHSKRQEHT
ncbi:MAG TPA: hypothetical protein VFJ51_07260, partial [Nitrososphaeraceae archaeon]|nr:hypothetical protein [Nitrososphaeraceae archaeon]